MSFGPEASTYNSAPSRQLSAVSPPTALVVRGLDEGGEDVRRLREDLFLEPGTVRDRRVEMLEKLAGHSRGNLGAEPARELILVNDDNPVQAFDERRDRLPVVG